jgi:hypothetical protein
MSHPPEPSWYVKPSSGRDVCDAKLVCQAMAALDEISAPHRTEAWQILVARYVVDLERLVADAHKAKGAT